MVQTRSRRIAYRSAVPHPQIPPMAAQAKGVMKAIASAYPLALTIPEIAVRAERYISTRQLPENIVRYYLPLLVHHKLIVKEHHETEPSTIPT